VLSALALAFFLVSCDDDTPTDGSSTTTTTPPATGGTAFLRAAPLTFDARNVDVVIGDQTFSALSYPEVSDYIELDAGEYRVQFFPAGSRTNPIGEASVTLSDDDSATVALVGLTAPQVEVFEDDRDTNGSQAGVTLVNTVPDFPAPFDLRVVNGDTLFSGVSYLGMSEVSDLNAGSYDIELLRGGTDEVVATSMNNNFAAGNSYTLYAAGSLRHGDIQLVVASDSP
jgi:hypothetical protein